MFVYLDILCVGTIYMIQLIHTETALNEAIMQNFYFLGQATKAYHSKLFLKQKFKDGLI